jgi:RimJ/RimL family protein N-acetyltransferase
MESPIVETNRLRLRPFEEADAPSVGFYTDPDVMRFIPGGARDRSLLETRFRAQAANARDQWSRHGFGMWAVTLKDMGALIGHCGLQHLPGTDEIEVYYLLDKPHWNKGIGTEATIAALRFGFERAGLARVVAIAMPDNIASQRVMQKAGMRLVGAAHHYGCDCIKYALSRRASVEEGTDERRRK